MGRHVKLERTSVNQMQFETIAFRIRKPGRTTSTNYAPVTKILLVVNQALL